MQIGIFKHNIYRIDQQRDPYTKISKKISPDVFDQVALMNVPVNYNKNTIDEQCVLENELVEPFKIPMQLPYSAFKRKR